MIAHERRATPPAAKRTASLRVAGKMAVWCVEKLGRIADKVGHAGRNGYDVILRRSHHRLRVGNFAQDGRWIQL